jgi:hypothetical protein
MHQPHLCLMHSAHTCSQMHTLMHTHAHVHTTVKVYDVQEYKVRYSVDYTQPILSMGISPDKGTLAVGMANGLLAVRSRSSKEMAERLVARKRDPRAGTYQYFIRGQVCIVCFFVRFFCRGGE